MPSPIKKTEKGLDPSLIVMAATPAFSLLLADKKLRPTAKKVCLPIYRMIKAAFFGDPDFE